MLLRGNTVWMQNERTHLSKNWWENKYFNTSVFPDWLLGKLKWLGKKETFTLSSPTETAVRDLICTCPWGCSLCIFKSKHVFIYIKISIHMVLQYQSLWLGMSTTPVLIKYLSWQKTSWFSIIYFCISNSACKEKCYHSNPLPWKEKD